MGMKQKEIKMADSKKPIHEIFTKKYWELAILKQLTFSDSAILIIFFQKTFFLLHSHENKSKFIG